MKGFQTKKSWRRFFESWPVLIILFGLVLFFALGVADFWSKARDTAHNKAMAEENLQELKKRQEKLSTDIEFIESTEGKEHIFREDFGLAREGEGVIVIIEEKKQEETQEKKGFFRFFEKIF